MDQEMMREEETTGIEGYRQDPDLHTLRRRTTRGDIRDSSRLATTDSRQPDPPGGHDDHRRQPKGGSGFKPARL